MLIETRETVIDERECSDHVAVARARAVLGDRDVLDDASARDSRLLEFRFQVLLLLVERRERLVFNGVCPTATLFPGVLAIAAFPICQLHPCPSQRRAVVLPIVRRVRPGVRVPRSVL